jgi:hypothetical protein
LSLLLFVGAVALWSWSFYRTVPIAPGPHAEADGKFDAFVSEGRLVTGYALERERFYSTHAIPLLVIAAPFAVAPLAWLLFNAGGETGSGTDSSFRALSRPARMLR